MHSVRTKILAVLLLCLLPMAVATRIFYWAALSEMRSRAESEMQTARSAFSVEFADDVATLQVAARLISSDPDLSRELAAGDRFVLYEHIDDFSGVYPDIRVYLTDVHGAILASSQQRHAEGSLADMLELRAALGGKTFSGITRLVFTEGGKQLPEKRYSYALVEPIDYGGQRAGAVVATFHLGPRYLDNTEQKEGLALALRVGSETIAANADHPEPNAQLATGAFALHELPDGRTVALTSFVPEGIGTAPGPVSVLAAKDVTAEFRASERFLFYRMLVLAVIAVLAIAAGLALANPMIRAIREIARVLPSVAGKRYELVQGVHTGDELQRLAETYNHMIGELLEARRQTEAFGKYLSRAARDAASSGNVRLGGTTLPATVLFSDIRSFTSLCERMEPENVLHLLNQYFTEMVGAVVRHQGIVDKFIGDCIMVVWGPPSPRPEDALNAIKAALEMRQRLAKLNVVFAEAGLPEIRTGIGIHTGQVVAGNMGAEGTAETEGKMEYTVIGDTVNVASRLESATKELKCDVLLSEDTYRLVASAVDVEPLSGIHVKGREQPIAVYRLIGLRAAQLAAVVA